MSGGEHIASADVRLTRINDRWELWLPEHRAARPEWVTGWERERLDSMAEYIGPGSVVYDVGSEEGDLTALWASWGAEVACFEPNPRVWPNIKTIWRANTLPHPLLCWVGFCGPSMRAPDPAWEAIAGSGINHRDGVWPGCADGPLIGDHGFLQLNERPDCPIVTIDHAAAYMAKPPTHITMDVEGSEYRVLLGAAEVLKYHRPRLWVSVHETFMREQYGDEPVEIERLLFSLGYEWEILAIDHEAHMHAWPT